ncbi:MAG TPA: class I SAM-dependent methyltransferase [Pseudohaliea sp.]|nr:class I SAM-dependent methyltransferase [Pseudohaliea sp.]
MSTRAEHWDAVFGSKPEEAMTWHEEEPSLSYELVTRYLAPGAPFIDVGGGSARLTGRLIMEGYGPVTVLDVSSAALARQDTCLDGAATLVEADVTRWKPPIRYAVWHDRAVFHFLTEPDDRAAYVAALRAGLATAGVAIIATFAADGPKQCSGLAVVRYAPEDLAELLETHVPGCFRLIDSRYHGHVTPRGHTQRFQYSVFQRGANG